MSVLEIEDEDSQPLVRRSTGDNAGAFEALASGSPSSGTTAMLSRKNEKSFVRRHAPWIMALLVTCIIAVFAFNTQDSSIDMSGVLQKEKKMIRKRDCPAFCSKRNDRFSQKWGGDMLDTSVLLSRAEQEREEVVQMLKRNYGEEYYPKIFMNEEGESVGRYGFKGAKQMPWKESPVSWREDVSRNRLLRKLMIKILKMQLTVEQEAKNVQGCDCRTTVKARKNQLRFLNEEQEQEINSSNGTLEQETNSNNGTSPTEEEEDDDDGLPEFYERFVWLNAGHSSAAGHGNRFNETYTAIVEATAKATFAAVGIDLEGRNYAMGGMSSAAELALCSEAVYGTDPDLMTWNFGMTDGGALWRHILFAYRRAMTRNRPVLLDIDFGGLENWNQRIQIMEIMEDLGLSALLFTESAFYEDSIKDGFPDMFGMNQEQIDAVPEYLRYFRCENKIEKGDPGCGDHKYTDECAPHKAPWHPGWKANALNGNMMALMMIDALIDALKVLDAVPRPHHKEEMLAHYQGQDNEDYELFLNSNFTDRFLEGFWNENITKAGVDVSLLFKKPIVCHTSLLPAETRYKGILFDKEEDGNYEKYEFGVTREDADKRNITDKSTMQLTYEGKINCPVIAAIDYKDYFYVSHNDGESTMTIPNKAEQKAYLDGTDALEGLILVSLVKCDWGRCPDGDMREDQVNSGNITLTVNSVIVEEMTPINADVLVLRHKDGYYWKANKHGQYDLTARVHVPGGYLRITSVILI